jgi:TetR/AcrR family tetracycline transcriptional repressor
MIIAPPHKPQARGRPGRISSEQVVDATLTLLQGHGVAGFTMAKLAKEMGVGVMSLYHYFPSKTDLLDAVSDRVFARFLAPDTDVDWDCAIREWVKAVHTFFSENPVALDLINWDSHISPAWLRVALPMLHILAKAGFHDQALALASRWLLSTVMGVVTTKRMSYRSSQPVLPNLDSLSPENKSLISAINSYYHDVPESDLIDLVAENIVDGLRKLNI